jgi:hypothetical protein
MWKIAEYSEVQRVVNENDRLSKRNKRVIRQIFLPLAGDCFSSHYELYLVALKAAYYMNKEHICSHYDAEDVLALLNPVITNSEKKK